MRHKILVSVTGLFLLAGLVTPGRTPAAAVETGGFLTVMAGRAEWAAAYNCQTLPGAVDLLTVGQRLAARPRPLAAYGTAVGLWTHEAPPRNCTSIELSATWADLAALRDQYGWTFGSNGADRTKLPGATLAEQWTTSCGALKALRAHGHWRAAGLFAWPKGGDVNDVDAAAQRDVVSKCFSYSRTYDLLPPYPRNSQGSMDPSGFQVTHTLRGGTCHDPDPAAACRSVVTSAGYSYDDPADLAALVQVPAGQWAVLQFHLLVEGSRTTGAGARWDCSSPDWRQHWSTVDDFYCWADFESALNAIPSTVALADPLTVAQAWGRVLARPGVTGVSPASGALAGGQEVVVSGQAFRAVGSASDGWLGRRGFRVTIGGRNARVSAVSAQSIRLVTPAGASAGPVDIKVTNADGLTTTARDAYRYG